MFHPHFLPESVAPILQWAEGQNWLVEWTITTLAHTLKFERGSRAMSFTLPADAKPSEWEAILTTWQQQNSLTTRYTKSV